MKRAWVFLIVTVTILATLVIIQGCSSTNGLPSVDIPPMPSYTTSYDISGTWTGSYGSYEVSGPTGNINPLKLEQSDNGNGTYDITGTMVMTGYPQFEDETGTVEGTFNTTTATFTATYGTRTMKFTANVSQSSSMSGTYYIYEGEEELDNGNFTLTKQ
ncbi:MAG: hypothetical protein LWY06_08900 [Firmicutes bacterium]|nr:hypothetical protein [Bacillota bacterium]